MAAGLRRARGRGKAVDMTSGHLNRRVIVIDDNAAIHDDFRKILCRRDDAGLASLEASLFGAPATVPRAAPAPDFAVDTASQGKEGWERIVAARSDGTSYAVAFIDMRMPPGWDGLETTARVLADDPDVQIVICTAYSDHSWEEMVARLGETDRVLILKKPFDTIEVRQLAMALCAKWSLVVADRDRLRDLEAAVEARTRELAAHAQRQQHEIEAAAKVQQAMLPPHDIRLDGARCAWVYHPSRELGGDLLGVQRLDGRRIALWMTDVSGHGVASSLLAVQVCRALSDAVGSGRTPGEVLRHLNDLFPFSSNASLFFTLFYAVLDLASGAMTYANAGHPYPVVQRADGPTTLLELNGVAIGWLESSEIEFPVGEVTLRRGDRLVLYSDGVTEARDPAHRIYGERLMDLLAARRADPPTEAVRALEAAVVAWMHGSDAEPDDVTALVLDWDGPTA